MKRFTLNISNTVTGTYIHGMREDEDGPFVKFDDAQERIAHLEQEGAATIEAYNAALAFALEEADLCEVKMFLVMWTNGEWPEIAEYFPEFDLGTAAPCGYMAVSEQIEGE